MGIKGNPDKNRKTKGLDIPGLEEQSSLKNTTSYPFDKDALSGRQDGANYPVSLKVKEGTKVVVLTVLAEYGDYLSCKNGFEKVFVAKPPMLRRVTYDGESFGGVSYAYSNKNTRVASDDAEVEEDEIQYITPTYIAGEKILAVNMQETIPIAGPKTFWQEIESNRSWATSGDAYLTVGNNLSDLGSIIASRANLGVGIGVDVQAWDVFLDDISDLTDPGTDRLMFWNDSGGAIGWLTLGTNLSITGSTISASNTPALTQEQVQDYVGAMFSGNTETFITATYMDGDGTIDLVVPVKDEDDMASDSAAFLATQQSIKAYVDSQVGTINGLGEVLALGNEADGTDLILDSGADLIVYSDDKVTEKARIDGATGNITTAGAFTDGTAILTGGAFTTVVGGVVPTASAHLATKEYVDGAVAGLHFDLFLEDTAAGIDPYGVTTYSLQDTDPGGAEQDFTSVALNDGDDQLIFAFSTGVGLPMDNVQPGVLGGHFHFQKTDGASKTVTCYWTLTHRTTGGSETLLATSENSSEITAKAAFDMHGNQASDQVVVSTDRLVLKVYADVAGGGATAQVIVYFEGTTSSHIDMRVETETLSSIFIRQDGTTPLTANWDVGNFDLTMKSLTCDGTLTDGTWSTTSGAVSGAVSCNLVTTHAAAADPHAGYVLHSLADAASDFLVASGNDVFVKKTLAETGAILEADIDHGNIQGLSTGADHSYIDQSVVSGASPTFTGTNISGIPAASILAGTFGTGAYVFDNTVSGITTLTATTLTDGTWSTTAGVFTGVASIDMTGDLDMNIHNIIAVDDIQVTSISERIASAGILFNGSITILDPTPILVFQDSDSSGASSVGFIEWRDSGGGRAGFLGNNSSGDDGFLWKNEQGGDIGIQTTGSGVFQVFADAELNANSITGVNDIQVTSISERIGSAGILMNDPINVNGDITTYNKKQIIYRFDTTDEYFQMGISGTNSFQFQRTHASAGTLFQVVNLAGGATFFVDFETGDTTTTGSLLTDSIKERSSGVNIKFWDPIYFQALVEEKISYYGDRFGLTTGYGMGVEGGTLYWKSPSLYRWYIAANADGGTSDAMELTATNLTMNGTITATGGILTDDISELTGSASVDFPTGLKTDTITHSGAASITIEQASLFVTSTNNRTFSVVLGNNRIKDTDGGGTIVSYGFIGTSGTDYDGFGVFLTDDTLNYYYVGTAFDNFGLKVDASSNVSIPNTLLLDNIDQLTGGVGVTFGTEIILGTNYIGFGTSSQARIVFGGATSLDIEGCSMSMDFDRPFNFGGGGSIEEVGAGGPLTISGGSPGVKFLSNMLAEGTIYIKENAAADGDMAGYGQLWTKDNAGTTELYFTKDDGTDVQLV